MVWIFCLLEVLDYFDVCLGSRLPARVIAQLVFGPCVLHPWGIITFLAARVPYRLETPPMQCSISKERIHAKLLQARCIIKLSPCVLR